MQLQGGKCFSERASGAVLARDVLADGAFHPFHGHGDFGFAGLKFKVHLAQQDRVGGVLNRFAKLMNLFHGFDFGRDGSGTFEQAKTGA